MTVPVVETARLRLRDYTAADADARAAMWADEGVRRFVGGGPVSTPEEAWAKLLRVTGLWSLLGYGYWLIEEKESRAYVGEVGFADFRRAMTPGFGDAPEQGWALTPAMHGKGYAIEAATGALDWARNALRAREYVCMIDPDNAPSLKVAEKLGYREFARTTYRGAPIVLLRTAGF